MATWEEEERTGEQLLVAFALWRKMKGLFGSDPGLLLPGFAAARSLPVGLLGVWLEPSSILDCLAW